jgi:hypothetical protein
MVQRVLIEAVKKHRKVENIIENCIIELNEKEKLKDVYIEIFQRLRPDLYF